jgi:cardiolipin synthase (CMP-forming)
MPALTLTWPNRITLLRLLLIAPFVVAILNLQDPQWHDVARWSALGVFVVMAISDGLDGYLARRLHQESALGRFLDPLADKILVLCSVILLAHRGTHVEGALLPSTVAVLAIAKDLVVVLGVVIVYMITSRAVIRPLRLGKWCTTVQLAMIIAILLYPSLPASLRWLPRVLWWAASVLAVGAMVAYFRLGLRFTAKYDPVRSGEKVSS